MGFLMLSHPLINFEIQKHSKNEPRFNGAFSRNNLPKKVKNGAYIINLDENAELGTHWIASFFNRNEIVYFDSFGVEHVPEEIKEYLGNKNIKANIFWVQANHSVMCGYFYIGSFSYFYLLSGKKLSDYISLSFPHDFKKSDDIILSYFKNEWK